jgi:hypothetical protein
MPTLVELEIQMLEKLRNSSLTATQTRIFQRQIDRVIGNAILYGTAAIRVPSQISVRNVSDKFLRVHEKIISDAYHTFAPRRGDVFRIALREGDYQPHHLIVGFELFDYIPEIILSPQGEADLDAIDKWEERNADFFND